ncbi:FadR/GntR family transcriptional regulator [Rhodococcus opacus]|uniref:FadR/GntR family transcriptional regulator n=1 Tax=Rhodococcus opacus TaxID=37919 RepID=UPI001C492AE8|nr:FadR/GntR family transcriptional regulator [Rhodococcus opacus]MBV6756691.1 FadR family transcriptional regulator [Rhodococcus opacus]
MTVTGVEGSARALGSRVMRPRQQVEESLRNAVLNGELRNGERLPSESELARQFGVSRPTIREALSALEQQGMIRKVPGAGGGSFVRPVDHHSLGEVLQESLRNLLRLGNITYEEVAFVRQQLEAPSAALAAENRSDAELAELRNIVQQQKELSVDDPDVPGLDAKFHSLIAQMSGNRILGALVYALHRETEPMNYLNLKPEVGRETVKQHQKITRAIQNQDAVAAETAIIDHLAYLRSVVKASDVPAGSVDDASLRQ